MRKLFGISCLLFLVAMLAAGCQPQGTDDQPDAATPASSDTSGHGHSHEGDVEAGAHAAPHGGHLVDLGRDHAFHAEMVDDHEAGRILVFILDGQLKPVTSTALQVTLVLTADGATRSFELSASEEGEPGTFESAESELLEMLDHESVVGKFRVSIDDKPYLGSFTHHDHGGDHDHSHGGAHDHEH